MASQGIWIGIVVGVFFVGIGISYAVFANMNNPGNIHMQENQMMPENMRDMMMGSNPMEQHESMLEIMQVMMEDENIMNHMQAHILENEIIVHQMLSMMDQTPHLKEHMAAHASGDLSEYAYLDELEHEDHAHEDEHQ